MQIIQQKSSEEIVVEELSRLHFRVIAYRSENEDLKAKLAALDAEIAKLKAGG